MVETTRFHVALNVRDLERSKAFYRDVLGLAPDKVHPGYVRFLSDEPALSLSLNLTGEVAMGSQVAHFGIRLGSPEALVAAAERLRTAGHALRAEHATLCCHAVQDKVWVVDPDGNEWELYHVTDDRPEPVQRPDPAARGCC